MMALWFFISMCAIAFGALEFMGGAMSDAPDLGDQAATQGCLIAGIGLVSLIACVVVWL